MTSSAWQPAQNAAQAEAVPTAASVRQTSFGVRRSCDACGRRKRKCDGERPCGRCTRLGGECTYSKRKWHLPQPEQDLQAPQQADRERAYQLQKGSTSGAFLAFGILPFKRCRLSASPATGLVGMRENGFLSDFFSCVGFLPLTTQSHIRETMVKIMMTPDPRRRRAVGDGGRKSWQIDDVEAGGERIAFRARGLPMDPSICIFWCAVALGALARGSPLQTVADYSILATEALSSSYGPGDAEVAKALVILAHLYEFMGDLARSQEFLVRANSSYAASIEQGSTDSLPAGFAELIKSGEVGYFGELELKSIQERPHPQLNGAASEAELYQYVMQSFQLFEQTVASKVMQSTAHRVTLGDAKSAVENTGDLPDPQELADAMVLAWATIDFEPLEEVVDRTLVLEAATTGDVHITLKRIGSCVDVLEQYPGLCRSVNGSHGAHKILTALAALDVSGARGMFDRLRATYNSCRSPDSLPVPPLEDWQGVSSVCDGLPCRAIEKFIASKHLAAFSTPSTGIRPDERGGDQHGLFVDPGGQREGGVVSAKTIHDGGIPVSTPLYSGNGGVRFTSSVSNTCDPFRGPSHVGHVGGAGWCLEPAGASMASTTSATNPPTLNFVHSEIRHSSEEGASRQLAATRVGGGGIAASPDTSVITPHLLGENDDQQGTSSVAHGGKHARCGVDEGVIDGAETTLTMQQVLGEGVVEEADDLDVGAADWLDATHALLGEVHEPGQEGIR